MAQMKEQIKAPEKTQLSDKRDSQPIRYTVQNTGNQDAHRNDWAWSQKEEMKVIQNKIKENIQGTNSEGKETGTQINGVNQKEERNIQPEQNEEIRIQKNEERLRNLQDNFKRSNIWFTRVPEGEEEEQEIENLFEQIMKENFPNLTKEIDFQKSRDPREFQRNWI